MAETFARYMDQQDATRPKRNRAPNIQPFHVEHPDTHQLSLFARIVPSDDAEEEIR